MSNDYDPFGNLRDNMDFLSKMHTARQLNVIRELAEKGTEKDNRPQNRVDIPSFGFTDFLLFHPLSFTALCFFLTMSSLGIIYWGLYCDPQPGLPSEFLVGSGLLSLIIAISGFIRGCYITWEYYTER